ncbi:hypothetical protein SD81_022455 [Tolypothrix campylonemoides VB511288]|nr:hypothetical protein SD81_022455 [Tolypothrix campylonemoides VB511288]
MSNSNLFKEAQDALYKAAKVSAKYVEVKLASKDTDFSPADKERLKVALSVLKITWSGKDDEKSDEHGDIPIYPDYKSNEYDDTPIYPDYESDIDDIPL